jgi:hypothetical protein
MPRVHFSVKHDLKRQGLERGREPDIEISNGTGKDLTTPRSECDHQTSSHPAFQMFQKMVETIYKR